MVGVYGHSQGSTVAALLASRGEVGFVVAGSAIVGPVKDQDVYRIRKLLARDGFSSPDVAEAMAFFKTWQSSALAGQPYTEPVNATITAKSWFDYVRPPAADSPIWSYYGRIGSVNTLDYWKGVSVPSLLIYGEEDAIEDVSRYTREAAETLDANGNRDYAVWLLPHARHELQIDSAPGAPFRWRQAPPWLYSSIADWIRLHAQSNLKIGTSK